jgi:hypothetical protein
MGSDMLLGVDLYFGWANSWLPAEDLLRGLFLPAQGELPRSVPQYAKLLYLLQKYAPRKVLPKRKLGSRQGVAVVIGTSSKSSTSPVTNLFRME